MDLWRWIRKHGTTWVVRGVFLAAAIYWALSGMGLAWAPLDVRTVFGLNIAILWLVFERINAHPASRSSGSVMPWNQFGAQGNDLIRRAAEIDIICSSGGTFYTQFAEALGVRSNVRIRVLMRKHSSDPARRTEKLNEMRSYWTALNDPEARRIVEVGWTAQDLLRGMRIDTTIALGYYRPDSRTGRLMGHTVDLLVVAPAGPHHAHFNQMFACIFGRLWAEREADPTEMPATPAS